MRATEWTLPRGTMRFESAPRIMAIINVTPDSFSNGGQHLDHDDAFAHCVKVLAQGADILDIGGESTRPGAQPVTADEEIRRVVPLVERLRATTDAVISIDTTKAVVADAALKAGADIINDISGMKFDYRMPGVVASHGAAVVLMHTPGPLASMHEPRTYVSIVDEVAAYLQERVDTALQAGVARSAIALDLGFGFGKDTAQNYTLANAIERFVDSGHPLLVGVSRKRMIRAETGDDPNAIEHGTSAFNALAAFRGTQILRVHDVPAAIAACAIASALRRS